MARTCTVGERALIGAAHANHYCRLELTDPDDNWVDVSADLPDTDWLNGATLSEDLDANAATFSATLLRDNAGLSLAPLMAASTINRDFSGILAGTGAAGSFARTDAGVWVAGSQVNKYATMKDAGGAAIGPFLVTGNTTTTLTFAGDATGAVLLDSYAPFLELHRRWRLSVAITAHGVAPVAGDWKELGVGFVDRIEAPGAGAAITITGRDLGALLLDTYIDTPRTYSPDADQSMEAVLQAILDDNLGAAAPTLYTPVSPSFVMNRLDQGPANVMEAITAIASLVGFVCRYRYDAADVLRLTLYQPQRAAVPGDEVWSLGPSEYLALPVHTLDLAGVRNFIEVQYQFLGRNQTLKVRSPTTGTSTSIARYGKRYMGIDLAYESQINEPATAQPFADAVRADLELPALEQQAETLGFWIVQLGDYGKWLANGVQHDSDQFGGVTQVQHTLANGTLRTVVGARGQPAGRYRYWLQLMGGLGLAPFTVASPRVIYDTGITYEVTFGEGCVWLEIYTRQNVAASGPDPERLVIDLAYQVHRPSGTNVASYRIAADASSYLRTLFVGYAADWTPGTTVGPIEDQVAAGGPPTTAPTISAHTDHGTSVDVTVDHNGVVTGDVLIYVNGTLHDQVGNTGGASQVVTPTGLAPSTAYSITATQAVAGVESAASGALATTTTGVTLDAPTSWHAAGFSGDPKMRFYWACGANATGASVAVEESTTGAWGGEQVPAPFAPSGLYFTDPGAIDAGSNAHASGLYYFRAKAQQTGYTDSAWTADEIATYGGDDL